MTQKTIAYLSTFKIIVIEGYKLPDILFYRRLIITDGTPYGEGQVLNIDTEKMVVTMVAHRGWGPDGKTI